MKAKTFSLNSMSDIGKINKALNQALTSNVKGNGEKIEISIRNKKTTSEVRRLSQNNIWYLWVQDYADAKKWTHNHARGHLKYYYALPVLRANSKNNALIAMFDAVADNLGTNKDLHLSVKLPMTSMMNIKEMHTCLTNTKICIESEENILLSDKDDDYFYAMGLKRKL